MSDNGDSFDFRREREVLHAIEDRLEVIESRLVEIEKGTGRDHRGNWRLWAILLLVAYIAFR